MKPSSDSRPPAADPKLSRRILGRHRPFFIAAAAALSVLFAEEAWAAAHFWPRLSPSDEWLLGALIVLVTLAGYWLSVSLPLRLAHPEKYPRPVGAFAEAFGQGMAITLATSGLALLLLLMLTGFSLEAAPVLLKDVYFYTLVAALIHGLVYYVRHMHWLYDEFGGADSPFKPIVATGGIGAVIFIITIVFLPMDLSGISAAPASLRALAELHIYVRDLYLLTLALGAYAWHLRWIADH